MDSADPKRILGVDKDRTHMTLPHAAAISIGVPAI